MKVLKRTIGIFFVFILVFGLAACNNNPADTGNTGDSTGPAINDNATNNEPVKVGKVDYAPHGNKAFAVAFAVMQGDKIVRAYIDEYQFLAKDGITGVPNAEDVAEGAFAANFKDPNTILASKRTNNDFYSGMMADHAGSTVTLENNYSAIENHVSGKTISELESELSGKDAEQVTDAVSGSTLADTKGYIEAIIAAAKNAK